MSADDFVDPEMIEKKTEEDTISEEDYVLAENIEPEVVNNNSRYESMKTLLENFIIVLITVLLVKGLIACVRSIPVSSIENLFKIKMVGNFTDKRRA